ncbi:MAG: hypothetical protein N2544_16320 [Burkholderiales bacterium]|nr:hypothetical protein [Burkholderiales bacterium]
MERQRGLTIHFNDGTRITIGFDGEARNRYAREILQDEFVKRRLLAVEADGAMLFIPFENIKYVTAFPAPDEPPRWALTGATLIG